MNKKKIFWYVLFTILIVCVVGSYAVWGRGFFKKTIGAHELTNISVDKKLNVLVISIETLRSDHMGVYGYTKDTTPHIDTWAKSAVVFDNYITVSPITFPSMAAVFTGLHPFTSGIYNNCWDCDRDDLVSNNVTTLAEILNSNGYVTGGFESMYYLNQQNTNLHQGFDTIKSYDYFTYEDKEYDSLIHDSLRFLETNKNNPFFMWIHYADPHAPYYPPPGFECKFDTSLCDEIAEKSLSEWHDILDGKVDCPGEQRFSSEGDEVMKTLYEGEIGAVDVLVGNLLQKLEQLQLDKNTIIVLLADHGESFEHQYYGHEYMLYDSTVHVPLIIKHPHIHSQLKREPLLIDNLDILPTILDLLQSDYDKSYYSGSSFADKILENDVSESTQQSFHDNYVFLVNSEATKFAIYDGRYKYIHSTNTDCTYKNQTEEFYDLLNDPNEAINVKDKKKRLASKYRSLLFEELSKYNLPYTEHTQEVYSVEEVEKIQRLIDQLGY